MAATGLHELGTTLGHSHVGPPSARQVPTWTAHIILYVLCLAHAPATASVSPPASQVGVERLQVLVDELRAQLVIPQEVHVLVVDSHPSLVAVERHASRGDAFLLQIEEAFLNALAPTEIAAALAHELGHVWIFTHHPYLHTEALANRIAQRVVSRDSLARLYEKMWAHQGTHGSLVALLGESGAADAAGK